GPGCTCKIDPSPKPLDATMLLEVTLRQFGCGTSDNLHGAGASAYDYQSPTLDSDTGLMIGSGELRVFVGCPKLVPDTAPGIGERWLDATGTPRGIVHAGTPLVGRGNDGQPYALTALVEGSLSDIPAGYHDAKHRWTRWFSVEQSPECTSNSII